MFNPMEAGVDQPPGRSSRRPSIGRIFYLSYLLGIPLLAVGGGIALLIASNQLDAAVQTYRSAAPCPSAATSTACVTLVPGTLVKFSISRGKSGDTADMTLRLPDGIRSTWGKTNWQQEDALRAGAPVQAEFYQGTMTTVYLGRLGIRTKDNPIYKQSDLRLGAVIIPAIGLIIATVSFFSMRGQKPLPVGSIVAIDRTLPIAEHERLLRQALLQDQPAETPEVTAAAQRFVTLPFTLRPHPIPTGRPWWVGLIAAAIAVPIVLLRLRTPGATAQVVLAATVAAMLAAVVLHWLYRNRRMLVVDDFTVRRVNLFGFSRRVSRTELARLAFPIVMSFAIPGLEPRLLLLDASGRCLLSLRRYYSTDEEAVQLAAALQVPLDMNPASRLTKASHLRRNVPGAVSWSEAHPYVTMLALILPMLALASLVVWVLNGFK